MISYGHTIFGGMGLKIIHIYGQLLDVDLFLFETSFIYLKFEGPFGLVAVIDLN